MRARSPRLLSAIILSGLASASVADPYCGNPAIASTDPNCSADALHAVAYSLARDPESRVLGAKYVIRPLGGVGAADLVTDLEVGGGEVVIGTQGGGLYVLRNGSFVKTPLALPAGQAVLDIAYGFNRWYIVSHNMLAGNASDSGNNVGQNLEPDEVRKGTLAVTSDLASFTQTKVITFPRTSPTAVRPHTFGGVQAVTVAMNGSLPRAFVQFDAPGASQAPGYAVSPCRVFPDSLLNAATKQVFICNANTSTLVRAFDPVSGVFSVPYGGPDNITALAKLKNGDILAFIRGARAVTLAAGDLSATSFPFATGMGDGYAAADDGSGGTYAVATDQGLVIGSPGDWQLIRGPSLFTGGLARVKHSAGAGFVWALGNRVFSVNVAGDFQSMADAVGLGPQYTQVLGTLAKQRDGQCAVSGAGLGQGDFDCQWRYLGLDDPDTYVVLDGVCTHGLSDVDCYVQQANALYGQAAAIAGGDLSSLRSTFGTSPGNNDNSKTRYYAGNAAIDVAEGAMDTDRVGDTEGYLNGIGDPLWDGYHEVAGVYYPDDDADHPLQQTVHNVARTGQILTQGSAAAVGAAQRAAGCLTSSYTGGSC